MPRQPLAEGVHITWDADGDPQLFWLKGVEQAHVVTDPNSLRPAGLSVG